MIARMLTGIFDHRNVMSLLTSSDVAVETIYL